MARLLGEARVSVLPDGTRFKPEAEAAVKKATAGLNAKIGLMLDKQGFDRKVEEVKTQIKTLNLRAAVVTLDADDKQAVAKMARVMAQLDKISARIAKAKTDVDISDSVAKLASIDAMLDNFGKKSPSAKADVNTSEGSVKLGVLDGLLDKFGLKRVSATATVDTAGGEAKLIGFSALLNKFGLSAGRSGNNGGKAFGNGFVSGLGKSAFRQNPGITAAIIAGLGALPAAIGAIGVLGGIALGAGLMIGAESLIKKQLKTLTTEIKQQTAIVNSKTSTAAMKTASEQIIKQDQAQVAALNKQKAAFNQVNIAVFNLKNTFLTFAGVVSKPLIKPFADALNMLSKELKGPLASSFTLLFKAVGPLVKPVVQALLEIVKGILPGLTDMLNKARGPLTTMFVTFGKIVGLKVGQWFRDAIPFIKDSATYLNNLVSIAGSAVSWLIKFGGATARAFGDPNLKGFGGIVSQIGNDLLKIVVPAFQGWIDVLAPVVRDLAKIMLPILNFLAANPGFVKAIAEVAAAMFVASKAVAVLRLAIIGLTIVSNLDPIVLAITAIAVAALLIIKYWKPISGFFVQVWKDIWSGFIGPLIDFFTKTIPHAFGVTIDWVKKNWPLLVGLLLAPMTLGMSLVLGVIVKYHNQIVKFISEIWGHIENVITGVLKPIASVMEGIWNGIFDVAKAIWGKIYNAIKTYVLISVGVVGEAWRGIKNLTGIIWPWIYNTTKEIWGKIENAITGVVKPLASVVSGQFRAMSASAQREWNWIFSFGKSVWGRIENAITGVVKPTASVVASQWQKMASDTKTQWNWIASFSKSVWGHIENTVTGIVKPLVNGIHGLWTHLTNWTSSAFQAIYKYIFNPLNKAASWVKNTFVSSVKNAFTGLVSTVQSIWNGLKKVVADPINFVIKNVWNPFAHFVDAGLSIFGIKDTLNDHVDTVKFARGGHVPGYAPGSDTVPAMLSPGEYVLNPTAAKAIGVGNLDALNSSFKPGGGQRMVSGAGEAFANGGDVVNDVTKWNGHKYVWGGGASPGPGWDCSSFVNWIVGHDFKLNLPGGANWAQTTNNGQAHGPVVSGYENWNYGRHVGWADAKRGDLALENGDGHIGFVVQDNTTHSPSTSLQGFAARSTATGTGFQQYSPADFHLVRFADDRGLVEQTWDNTGGAVLKAAAQAALDGISAIANGALNKMPGTGPFKELPKAAINKIIDGAKNKLNGNQGNFEFTDTNFGPDGIGPPGTGGGTGMQNGEAIFAYLRDNLFGGNAVAAAGATASIWGESTSNGVFWNPFSVGTGGRGLIGWTPEGTISDADFKGGLRTQLPAILRFVDSSGDRGVISLMEQASSVTQAAQEWMVGVERAGISDIHPEGIALATQIMNSTAKPVPNAPKAPIPPGHHHASGGHIPGYAPGSDTVHAMLSPGEYVLNPTAVKALGVDNLNAINFGIKPGSVQKFAKGGTVAPTTAILSKESQIKREVNIIHALQAVKHPTAAQKLALENDNVTLKFYEAELNVLLSANNASAKKKAQAALAAAKKAKAAEAKKMAQAGAEATLAATLEKQYGATPFLSDPKVLTKVDQIISERLRIGVLENSGQLSASQIATLDSDKLKLNEYEGQLKSLVASDKNAAKTKAVAQAAAKAQAADNARVFELGTHHSHSWLVGTAARVQKQMNSYAKSGNVKSYVGAAGYYDDLEAAISKWPTQLNATHDAVAGAYHTDVANAKKALAAGNQREYMIWNQKALGNAAKLSKIDNQIAQAANGTAPVNTSTLNPVQKLAYFLGNSDAKDWSGISYQLRNHSLDPAPVGKLSHSDMSSLALNVTPSVLDALYGGPGAGGANWRGLASALTGDLFNNSGIYNAGSGTALTLLGKLTGQHGMYAGKKFAQGGWINEHVVGMGMSSGMPYSFGEGGRREKVLTDAQSQQGGNGMTSAQAERLIAAVDTNTKAVAYYGGQTAKGLGHAGRSIQ